MASNTVDLNQAEQAVSSLLSTTDEQQRQQQKYQPKTLHHDNYGRCLYLPFFPTIYANLDQPLLLANIPG